MKRLLHSNWKTGRKYYGDCTHVVTGLYSYERGCEIGEARYIRGAIYFCGKIRRRLFGILVPKVTWEILKN